MATEEKESWKDYLYNTQSGVKDKVMEYSGTLNTIGDVLKTLGAVVPIPGVNSAANAAGVLFKFVGGLGAEAKKQVDDFWELWEKLMGKLQVVSQVMQGAEVAMLDPRKLTQAKEFAALVVTFDTINKLADHVRQRKLTIDIALKQLKQKYEYLNNLITASTLVHAIVLDAKVTEVLKTVAQVHANVEKLLNGQLNTKNLAALITDAIGMGHALQAKAYIMEHRNKALADGDTKEAARFDAESEVVAKMIASEAEIYAKRKAEAASPTKAPTTTITTTTTTSATTSASSSASTTGAAASAATGTATSTVVTTTTISTS